MYIFRSSRQKQWKRPIKERSAESIAKAAAREERQQRRAARAVAKQQKQLQKQQEKHLRQAARGGALKASSNGATKGKSSTKQQEEEEEEEEAEQALPSGWKELVDKKTGRKYYVNTYVLSEIKTTLIFGCKFFISLYFFVFI
jgi:hypothetical protein